MRGQHERQQVAVEPATLCRFGSGGDRLFAQPIQLGGVGDQHRSVIGVGPQVVPETGGQDGQLGVDRRQPLLLGRLERRSGPYEVSVVALQQPQVLRTEAERIPLCVHGIDPSEEPPVEHDLVAEGGENRRIALLELP